MNDAILNYTEAKYIYDLIMSNLRETNEDENYLRENLIKRAITYNEYRVTWCQMTLKEKAEADENRTCAHNAFISAVNMIDRYQKCNTWREVLSENRKRIGDFALYICLFKGLEAR